MTRFVTVVLVAFAALAGCGGSQRNPDSGEGAAERAGKDFDKAAGNVKKTGDEVGSKVGKTLGHANDDIRDKLGVDDEKDAGAATTPKDGG
jgi:hypothetical protein